ncbi:5'-methylthioadenosine phosphorylase [Aureimonas flava]|uniref:5'-methylthioadenosine phosphorylase n=1 Tax=Aureimonas flava TaxID=2320271 RepID=A0A3A1WRQ9_9HYPH|nr:5'-methylthioadenosine phosphorylase [Aureimonas flava]RIY03251.1 5'-methylthioadenosine phosphorylase [Aureimonas flava]
MKHVPHRPHGIAKTIPQVSLAVITGSANWGLAFPEDVDMPGVTVLERDVSFDTPYGTSDNWKILELSADLFPDRAARRALCMYSHGNPRGAIDHSCHRRAFAVLQEAGVKRVLACSTVGSVNRAVLPGDFVINADIIEMTQTPFSLLPGRQSFDCSGKRLVCPSCAATLAETATRHWPSSARVHRIEEGLVAAHAYGPRLTSPAEAMAFRMLGADLINHSIAPEATLSREIGACFVPCAYVTAGMNDYLDRERGGLLHDDVLAGLAQTSSRVALEALVAIATLDDCDCNSLKSPQPEIRASRF